MGAFFINYLSTELFKGNLAGIPLAQQLGLSAFLAVTFRDFPLIESAFPVSEHEWNNVKTINKTSKEITFKKTEVLFMDTYDYFTHLKPKLLIPESGELFMRLAAL